MARVRNLNALTMLVALVMFLAACGVNEAPVVEPDAPPPGEISETESKDDGTKDGEEKKDETKDEDEKDDHDEKKGDEKDDEKDDWNRGTATEECRYVAGVEGVDAPLFGEMSDGKAPWVFFDDIEVDVHEDDDGVESVSWRDTEEDGVEVRAVKVYGGETPATYWYLGEDAGAMEDAGLTAQPFGKKEPATVTDVAVCVTPDIEPTIEKTADPELERTWSWTLDKTATYEGPTEVEVDASTGVIAELPPIAYAIDVTASLAEVARVSGTVTIDNPAPFPMEIEELGDRLTDAATTGEHEVDLACEFSDGEAFEGDVLPAETTIVCAYEHELAEAASGENVAWLDYRYDVKGLGLEGTVEDRADFDFDGVEPSVVRHGTSDLHDTLVGLDEAGLPTGFVAETGETNAWHLEYAYWPEDLACGEHAIENAAVLEHDGNELARDATLVEVTVVCVPDDGEDGDDGDDGDEGDDGDDGENGDEGEDGEDDGPASCTLTQGYWKNHHDEWMVISPDDPFLVSGYTYGELLDLAVGGDVYVRLAHQVIAAQLNVAAGVDLPSHVETALYGALDLLVGVGIDAEIDPEVADDVQRPLDEFNNGNEGVPHCDDVDEPWIEIGVDLA